MTPTPTPAHQAFREKRAEKYMHPREADTSVVALCARAGFLAGMEAEHQVAKLMGRLEVYGQQLYDAIEEDSIGIVYWREKYEETEKAIAALLEGK